MNEMEVKRDEADDIHSKSSVGFRNVTKVKKDED